MKLSKRSQYGIRAMVALAQDRQTHSVKEIAQRAGVPKKFLEQLLLALKSAGFVASMRGKEGGYTLRGSPRDVSLADIIRALDGPLAPLPCASRARPQRCSDCPNPDPCWMREVMLEVRDAIAAVLETHSLAATAERAAAGPPPGHMYYI
jgi:Rrf2 family protein